MDCGMDIDKFGQMMDDIIKEAEINLLITMPEGTMDVTIKDSLGCGNVPQLYILCHAFERVLTDLCDPEKFGLDPEKIGDVLDGILNWYGRMSLKR